MSDDITRDIMNTRKLNKIRQEIASARKRANTHRDLERIARSLGRHRLTGVSARGKEPTYASTIFLKANMITIPNHGNKTFGPRTQSIILDQLEEDVDRWEEKLTRDKKNLSRGNGHDKTNS